MDLELFFRAAAVPMKAPAAYGLFHILFTLTGFAVCGFAAWRLRRSSDRTVNRILFWCGLVLALSEVFKQFFCYYVIAEQSYHWGEFPFQLCSTPICICAWRFRF